MFESFDTYFLQILYQELSFLKWLLRQKGLCFPFYLKCEMIKLHTQKVHSAYV